MPVEQDRKQKSEHELDAHRREDERQSDAGRRRDLAVLEHPPEVLETLKRGGGRLLLVDDGPHPLLAVGEHDGVAGLVDHRNPFAGDLGLAVDLEEGDVEGVAEREHGEREHPEDRGGEEEESRLACPAHGSGSVAACGRAARDAGGAAKVAAAGVARGRAAAPGAGWGTQISLRSRWHPGSTRAAIRGRVGRSRLPKPWPSGRGPPAG